MDYMTHLTSDPEVMSGECVFRGTRITLRTIVASLADGSTHGEILRNYPALKQPDIDAALAFAVDCALACIPLEGLPSRPVLPDFDA